MSKVAESDIDGRELEFANVVSAMDACFECPATTGIVTAPSRGVGSAFSDALPPADSRERRALRAWFQPRSRLDWFSSYTMKSVLLIFSFLAIGLLVSSLVLSF